jgi:hypothetical protein
VAKLGVREKRQGVFGMFCDVFVCVCVSKVQVMVKQCFMQVLLWLIFHDIPTHPFNWRFTLWRKDLLTDLTSWHLYRGWRQPSLVQLVESRISQWKPEIQQSAKEAHDATCIGTWYWVQQGEHRLIASLVHVKTGLLASLCGFGSSKIGVAFRPHVLHGHTEQRQTPETHPYSYSTSASSTW